MEFLTSVFQQLLLFICCSPNNAMAPSIVIILLTSPSSSPLPMDLGQQLSFGLCLPQPLLGEIITIIAIVVALKGIN
jgi:hypothetical protein